MPQNLLLLLLPLPGPPGPLSPLCSLQLLDQHRVLLQTSEVGLACQHRAVKELTEPVFHIGFQLAAADVSLPACLLQL